jgi:Ca2+/H+ antiporter, TMEM165/GDT1 family
MLAAFTAGLLLITISELGDKTFFIAVILAMRYPRRWVFVGVIAALAAMTIISVLLGSAVAELPKTYVHYGEIVLFLAFGFKLLFDASRMSAEPASTEMQEAMETVNQSAAPCPELTTEKVSRVSILPILLQSFSLTFLAEWGDRTQIATIALAASQEPIGVTAGAILGHSICAMIAVIGGRLIAGRISERTITAIGGGLFLIFGVVAGLSPT